MWSKSKMSFIFLSIVLLLFFIFFIIPLFYGVFISFTDWDGIQKNYNIIGLYNYVKMFTDTRFINAVKTTVKYFLFIASGSMIFGYINAKMINRLLSVKAQVLFITLFPYTVTPVIVCIIWNQLYINLFPIIGKRFGIGFLETNVLSDLRLAIFAVGIVDLWMLIPFAMILFFAAIQSIPNDLIEVSKLDGASFLDFFYQIELPYLLPTVGMILIIVLFRALTNIDNIIILTSGGPARATETVYFTIFRNSTEELHYAYGLAEGVVVSLLIVSAYLMIHKNIISKYSSELTLYELT